MVELIRPCFDKYAKKYDARKYPPKTYRQLLHAFGAPRRPVASDIEKAILWKSGHLCKARIPARHEKLISELKQKRSLLFSALVGSTAEVFRRLQDVAGGRHRYITVSFLLHLLRPTEVPIIDQHNSRAMNHYFRAVRSGWRSNARPSSYEDLTTLSRFVKALRSAWRAVDPATVPSERELDRYLMMFGKALNSRRRKRR